MLASTAFQHINSTFVDHYWHIQNYERRAVLFMVGEPPDGPPRLWAPIERESRARAGIDESLPQARPRMAGRKADVP